MGSDATTAKTFAERIANDQLLIAEGYVFELERRGYIKAGPFVPEVVLDRPEAVVELHREFLRAGSNVMVALTYYAHKDKLKDVGRENDLEAMNRQALSLARQVADEGNALVAGNVCNTWSYDPENHDASSAVVRAMYEQQMGWAAEAGVDFLLSETNDFLGEARIALQLGQELNLPVVSMLASFQDDKTRDGFDYIEAAKILADEGAAAVGFNCSRGPETMMPLLEKLRAAVDIPIGAAPVPYRTVAAAPDFMKLQNEDVSAFPIQLEMHQLSRFEMANFAADAKALGVNIVGICCGAGPHHVRAMAEAMGRTVPASKYSPAMELHPVLGDARY